MGDSQKTSEGQVGASHRSEGGVQGPVAEAVLEEQEELLLHETLDDNSGKQRGRLSETLRGTTELGLTWHCCHGNCSSKLAKGQQRIPPLELFQRAGVGVGVGGRRGRQLLGLQAVGEGVKVFHKQTHHQHVLLCGAERFLQKSQSQCAQTLSQSASSSSEHSARTPPRCPKQPKMERFRADGAQRPHLHQGDEAAAPPTLCWWAAGLMDNRSLLVIG